MFVKNKLFPFVGIHIFVVEAFSTESSIAVVADDIEKAGFGDWVEFIAGFAEQRSFESSES